LPAPAADDGPNLQFPACFLELEAPGRFELPVEVLQTSRETKGVASAPLTRRRVSVEHPEGRPASSTANSANMEKLRFPIKTSTSTSHSPYGWAWQTRSAGQLPDGREWNMFPDTIAENRLA
jgi:hypothetical protein